MNKHGNTISEASLLYWILIYRKWSIGDSVESQLWMSEYRRIDFGCFAPLFIRSVSLLVCKSVCRTVAIDRSVDWSIGSSVGDSVTRSLTVSDCLTNGRRFLSSRSHVYKETKSCKTLAYLPMLEWLSAHDSRELPWLDRIERCIYIFSAVTLQWESDIRKWTC